MNKKSTLLSAFLLGSLAFSTISHSSEAVKAKKVNSICKFQETAEINIRFDSIIDEAVQADIEIKKITADIEAIANQQGIELIVLKSLNFNINSQRENQGNRYRLNGSIRYKMDPYLKSLVLIDVLKGSGYQISLSVNKYQNNC